MAQPNPPLLTLIREGNPLDWSALDRTLLLLFISLYLPLLFWISLYVYSSNELAPYLNMSVVRFNIQLCQIFLVGGVLMLALGIWQRRYRRDWPFLSHLLAQGYTLGMVYAAWVSGMYTSNGSLLIVAGLALGLPLLDSRCVFLALVSGIFESIAFVAAGQKGYIGYAPLFDVLPFNDDFIAPSWAISQFVLIVNTIGAVWVIMASLIKRWRQRELDLLSQMETQEKLATLGEFSARIIHQTRHQLGLMGISIHKLKRQLEQEHFDVEFLKKELENLNDVQDKLRLTLKEDLDIDPSGELEDKRSFREVLSEEVDNLRQLALQEGVTIKVVFEEKLSDKLFPKLSEEWGQGVFNIIENAISVARQLIMISTRIEDDSLVIVVADDGPGIPERMISQVMQPFVTTKPDGNGMGLAIAAGVTRKEGGSLSLQNIETGGLQVIFKIPVADKAAK